MKTRIHTYKTLILPTNCDWFQAGEGMSYENSGLGKS